MSQRCGSRPSPTRLTATPPPEKPVLTPVTGKAMTRQPKKMVDTRATMASPKATIPTRPKKATNLVRRRVTNAAPVPVKETPTAVNAPKAQPLEEEQQRSKVQAAGTTPQTPKPGPANPERSCAASSCKGSSTSSAGEQHRLRLQRLEEEKQLALRRLEVEASHLERKYSILEEAARERSSACSSRERSSGHSKISNRTREWVNSLNRNSPRSEEAGECPPRTPINEHTAPTTTQRCAPMTSTMVTHGANAGVSTERVRYSPRELTAVQPSWSRQPDDFQLSSSQVIARKAAPRHLPAFKGDPEDWPLFITSFQRTTQMCGYTEEENIVRLQSSLQGKALETVRSLLMHPGNLEKILDTLQTRFGQPEVIVHKLIEKVRRLPPVREDRPETFMDFAVELQNLCATAEVCGLEEYAYNLTLLHQLAHKLSPTLRLNWAEHRSKAAAVSLTDFSKWAYSLAKAVCAVSYPVNVEDSSRPTNSARAPCHTAPFRGAVNTHNVTGTSQCPICKGPCPTPEKCTTLLDANLDERWEHIKKNKVCSGCLKTYHGRCSEARCSVSGCGGRHHALLHNTSWEMRKNSTVPRSQANDATVSCHAHRSTSDILFRFVPVTLQNGEKSVDTFAFLDEGSELTLLDNDLAKELNLVGPIQPLGLRWTGGTERIEENSMTVALQIKGQQQGAKSYQLRGVRTVNSLGLAEQTLDARGMQSSYPHLKDVPIASYVRTRPRILIGIHHHQLGVGLECREGRMGDPVAVKTRLGWTLCGGARSGPSAYILHTCARDRAEPEEQPSAAETRLGWTVHGQCREKHMTEPSSAFLDRHICNYHEGDNNTNAALKQHFALDSLGVYRATPSLRSTDEEKSLSILKTVVQKKEGHYEASSVETLQQEADKISNNLASITSDINGEQQPQRESQQMQLQQSDAKLKKINRKSITIQRAIRLINTTAIKDSAITSRPQNNELGLISMIDSGKNPPDLASPKTTLAFTTGGDGNRTPLPKPEPHHHKLSEGDVATIDVLPVNEPAPFPGVAIDYSHHVLNHANEDSAGATEKTAPPAPRTEPPPFPIAVNSSKRTKIFIVQALSSNKPRATEIRTFAIYSLKRPALVITMRGRYSCLSNAIDTRPADGCRTLKECIKQAKPYVITKKVITALHGKFLPNMSIQRSRAAITSREGISSSTIRGNPTAKWRFRYCKPKMKLCINPSPTLHFGPLRASLIQPIKVILITYQLPPQRPDDCEVDRGGADREPLTQSNDNKSPSHVVDLPSATASHRTNNEPGKYLSES